MDATKFFQHIKQKYNIHTSRLLKQYSREVERLAKHTERVKFLQECKQTEITPMHTNNATKRLDELFTTTTAKKELQKIKTTLNRKLVNIEIRETHVIIKTIKGKIKHLESDIHNTLNEIEIHGFEKGQWEKFYNNKRKIKQTHATKIRKLRNEKFNTLKFNFNEDWFVNYTNVNFEMESKWLLSLGNKFALPVNQSNLNTIPLIADMEQWIQDINDDTTKDIIRSKMANRITLFRRNLRNSEREKFILAVYDMTMKIIMKHRTEIMITTADKGNKTVILYRKDYMKKMEKLLDDKNTYKVLRTDPTPKLQRTNNNLLNQLYKDKHINIYDKRKMTNHAACAPQLYGLPKIHKENIPLRPISSSTKVPCYDLAKFVGKILRNLISPVYNIKNSIELKNNLKKVVLHENDILVSFDVVSLFTNIPVHLAIKNILLKWDILKTHTTIPKKQFLKLLQFCLEDNNYFQFNSKFYNQTYGMPMGSPLSPIIADIVLDTLLDDVIDELKENGVTVKCLSKYVDDLFAVIKAEDADIILRTLNNYHNRIKFTIEHEIDNELPYLDMKIIRKGNQIRTNWYMKSMASGRIINYHSTQPMKMKHNTAANLIERVLKISDSEFRGHNLFLLREILRKNNFPIDTIKMLMDRKLHGYRGNNDRGNAERIFYSVPYIPKLTDTKILKHMMAESEKTTIAHRSNTTIRRLFTNKLSKVDKLKMDNVVYEIQCNGNEREKCNRVYVGTTKRMLATRIAEHESDVRKQKTTTALSQHAAECKHTMNFSGVKILDKERKERKRYTLESLRIQQRIERTMNTKEDKDNTKLQYSAAIFSLA